MGEISRPIQRSILAGCAVFAVLLCIALSIPSSMVISSALYERYDADLRHILNAVEARIDEDGLHECYVSGNMSQEYRDLQAFLNEYVDIYELEYLYCVVPDEKNKVMRNVISATSAAERAEGAEDMPLNDISDAYSVETLHRFEELWKKPGISYFEEDSEWGAFYTAVLPLKTSNGETFAILCADIPIDQLHQTVNMYTMASVLIIVLISATFSLLLALWMRRNVTKPLAKLEESTRSFAESSHDATDPDSILFTAPEINTRNEVESLSDAITKMADDMRAYVYNAVSAEERARSAEEEAEGISAIAYQDALTHVKSNAAFENVKATLIAGGHLDDESGGSKLPGEESVESGESELPGEESGGSKSGGEGRELPREANSEIGAQAGGAAATGNAAAAGDAAAPDDAMTEPETAEFALVMVDMNGLKGINDTYGHDHGDLYIVGTCHMACEVFKHSPVYRVGGDEFVIVLKGSDFHDREALAEELRNRFKALEGDTSCKPWERYSAAVGVAVYDPQVDTSVDDVLHRADGAMYEDKRVCKLRAHARRMNK